MPDKQSLPDSHDAIIIRHSKTEASIEPLELGKRVKQIRLSQNLTLEEASKRTGLASSTLSKIENEQISPTFSAVTKLVSGLGIDIPQLFAHPTEDNPGLAGRRDITRSGTGKPHPTKTYEHELLSGQLSNKKMLPFKTTVRARRWEDFRDWVRHDGEEFLYVLSGSLLFYSEFYEPIELFGGDSIYYDCRMGHALLSTSVEDAEALWVTAC